MGAATTAAPYGFWATNPTKKLAHWVYFLGQPLSRNRVFQNFSGEPPPPPPPLINENINYLGIRSFLYNLSDLLLYQLRDFTYDNYEVILCRNNCDILFYISNL